MKILLTHPDFKGVVLVPTLGLGFMGTYVKENSDCQVEIIEPLLQRINEEQLLGKAKEADIVGLSCYTQSRFQVFDFARKVKEANPKCKLIVGGPHIDNLDKQILSHYPFIDVASRGESEQTILDIVNGKPYWEIPGITFRDKEGKAARTPDRTMSGDLDCFHYDYSLVWPQVQGWKDLEIPEDLQKLNSLPIIASRGCPFRCSFCASNERWGKLYRALSPQELVGRLKELVLNYDIKYFRFYDALFTGDNKRIFDFCDLIEREGLKISFRIDVRVGTDRQVLKRLREVGCEVVGFGVESGSDKILKRIRKGITRKQIEETIKICKDLDYWLIGFFMISLPDETMEDFRKTFELFKYFDETNLQFYKVLPNTFIYQELKQKGEIDDEIWFDPARGEETRYGNEIYYCKENFPSANFSRDEVEAVIERLNFTLNVRNPQKTFRRQGILKGAILLLLSLTMDILLRSGTGRKFYYELQNIKIIKALYRWLTKKKKEEISLREK